MLVVCRRRRRRRGKEGYGRSAGGSLTRTEEEFASGRAYTHQSCTGRVAEIVGTKESCWCVVWLRDVGWDVKRSPL